MRVSGFTEQGAWIEINETMIMLPNGAKSLPTRERGLKCGVRQLTSKEKTSLPTRERGLKLKLTCTVTTKEKSLPTRERGLK